MTWLEIGLQDMLISKLASLPNLVTIERRLLSIVTDRVARSRSFTSQEALIEATGREIRADWVIKGSFFKANEYLRVQAQLQPLNLDFSMKSIEAEGLLPDDISRMIAELSQALVDVINNGLNTARLPRQLTEIALPKAPDSYYKGVLAYENGSLRRALLWLRETIQTEIDFSPAHNMLVNTYERMKNAQGAVSYYLQLKKKYAKNPVVRNYLGNALMAANNLAGAQLEYEMACSLNPNYAAPYNNLGNLCRKWGLIDQARHNYEKALSLNIHEQAIVFNNLGLLHADANQFDKAEEFYKKAVDRKYLPYQTLYNLGNLYLRMRNHAKAIEYFTAALKIYPNFQQALQNLGHAYSMSGDLFEAREIWAKLHKSYPTSILTLTKLAEVCLKLNDDQKATQYIETAMSHDSLSADVWKLKGILERRAQHNSNAIQAFSNAVKLNPADWQSLMFLGQLQFREKAYPAATEILESSLKALQKVGPNQSKEQEETILEILAKSYERVGNYPSALHAYRRLIELNPKNSGARLGVRKLEKNISSKE